MVSSRCRVSVLRNAVLYAVMKVFFEKGFELRPRHGPVPRPVGADPQVSVDIEILLGEQPVAMQVVSLDDFAVPQMKNKAFD